MLKKLLITLTILTLNLFATSDLGMYYNKGDNFIGIYPSDGSTTINENNQDWVGVYVSDASNDWDNVIQWAWVKDLDSYSFDDDGVTKHAKMFADRGLDKGDYEVRYFLNNTFDTYKSHSFSLEGEGNNHKLTIDKQTDTTLDLASAKRYDDTWIGIYKKDAGNDWENVKAWSWVRANPTSIDISNLSEGDYEARLFFNNSYKLEAKVQFYAKGIADANIEITDQTLSNLTLNSTHQGEQEWQTWIGVYEAGAANEWENVKSWSWVTQNETRLDISDLKKGDYEARLFYNNSYELEKKVEFTIEDNGGKVTRAELDAMIENGEDYSQVDVSGITDMSRLFEDKEVKFDITGWNVSGVTKMNTMFRKVRSFNQPIGNWDVSNVTDMSYMFQGAEAEGHGINYFNQPIGNWNVSNVTDISFMFANSVFNQPIGNWDVSNVNNMYGIFDGAKSFNQPIGDWDVSNVIDMHHMFWGGLFF